MATEIITGNSQVRNTMLLDSDGVVLVEKTEKARYIRQNVLTVKQYGDKEFRIVLQPVRREGWKSCEYDEYVTGMLSTDDEDGIDIRSGRSIWRTRSLIREYALCNKWDYFFTGTFDPQRCDRWDLKTLQVAIAEFIRTGNARRKYNDKEPLKYLLIPEPHKNGAWHFHGLLAGLDERELRIIKLRLKCQDYYVDKDTGAKLPLNMIRLIQDGHELYDWTEWTSRYGWCDVERVKNEKAVAEYVRKYVTKTLLEQKRSKWEHLYFSSNGLERHKQLLQSFVVSLPNEMESLDFWDYIDENCRVKVLEYSSGNIDYINSMINNFMNNDVVNTK
jgi:hypothetical protein